MLASVKKFTAESKNRLHIFREFSQLLFYLSMNKHERVKHPKRSLTGEITWSLTRKSCSNHILLHIL